MLVSFVDISSCIALACKILFWGAILMFYLDAGLLARSQYPEGPATGHLGTGFFSLFPCV
jgi:hypothetical protein